MKKILSLVTIVLTIFLLQACPQPKPDKELQQAKEKLELAQKEEANVLAENEYKIAESNYQEATNLVEKGKNEEAKSKALISITNSEKAINLARKKKAENELSKLNTIVNESSELKMDVIYPEDYQNITNSYQTSLTLYNLSNYYDSYTNSKSILPQAESKLKELKDKWNTARTELNRAITRAERLKRIAKWLISEVQEIEELINQAKFSINEYKLNESIEKSQQANSKLDQLAAKLRDKNQQELERTGEKIKELKINKIELKFMYFSKNAEVKTVAYQKLKETEIKLALLYEETATPSKETESKSIKDMSTTELEEYKNKLEVELENIKEEIKTLYSKAQEDYNNANYEDSLENIDKVNELIEMYKTKLSELEIVKNEINKRKEIKEVKKIQEEKKYRVQPGDFLSKIATKLFKGQYWWWPKIFVSNKDKIKDPDLIEKDTELTIPEIPEE